MCVFALDNPHHNLTILIILIIARPQSREAGSATWLHVPAMRQPDDLWWLKSLDDGTLRVAQEEVSASFRRVRRRIGLIDRELRQRDGLTDFFLPPDCTFDLDSAESSDSSESSSSSYPAHAKALVPPAHHLADPPALPPHYLAAGPATVYDWTRTAHGDWYWKCLACDKWSDRRHVGTTQHVHSARKWALKRPADHVAQAWLARLDGTVAASN